MMFAEDPCIASLPAERSATGPVNYHSGKHMTGKARSSDDSKHARWRYLVWSPALRNVSYKGT